MGKEKGQERKEVKKGTGPTEPGRQIELKII